jgi:hypothetical protein
MFRRIFVYVLSGLLAFGLTSFFLFRKNQAKSPVRYTAITGKDSCSLKYPEGLRDSKEGMILLYVDTKPCAKCSESLILKTVDFIRNSGLTVEPVMLYHPAGVSDSSQVNEYYSRFADEVRLVVSIEDPIMTDNPWMQSGFGFYGIVTDSADRVKFAGPMLDPGFLSCCSREFGIKDTEWE